jgi:DNA-binding NtrC family response regulator
VPIFIDIGALKKFLFKKVPKPLKFFKSMPISAIGLGSNTQRNAKMARKRKENNSLLKKMVGEFEREVIISTYQTHKENQVKTAKTLGINRNTLRSRLEEYQYQSTVKKTIQ